MGRKYYFLWVIREFFCVGSILVKIYLSDVRELVA